MSIGTMSESEYRALDYNSSSSLKDFSLDRRKYYRKYILGEKIKEKPNKASDMGRLVETLLMEPDRFDEMFFMSSCVKIPGGMTGDFIYALAEIVGRDSEKEGFDFETAAREAYKVSGFSIKFETVLKKLDDPENRLYYEECLKVEHLGMTMVEVQDITNAEQIVEALRSVPQTSDICQLESGPRYTVINQMKIEDYVIDGMRLKSMLDKVIIDNEARVVKIYDLKCTWSVENFFKEYYLYRRTYIQAYLYYKAICYLAATDESCGFYGYKVEYPQFIVCDSINYYQPLIYTLSERDMIDAYEGFEHKDRKYEGVKKIIDECQWAVENDIWNISKLNFHRNGTLNIKD